MLMSFYTCNSQPGLQNIWNFSHPVQETLSVVNLEALPDKGERLRTQVKQLEDALESLGLSAATEPG